MVCSTPPPLELLQNTRIYTDASALSSVSSVTFQGRYSQLTPRRSCRRALRPFGDVTPHFLVYDVQAHQQQDAVRQNQ